MAVTIEEAGTGIKEQIDDIATLKQVFAPNELSKSPNVFPCALIIPDEIAYAQAFDGDLLIRYRILVLCAPLDSKVGMDTLLPLMERAGDNSVYAKINADPTLGGRGYAAKVISCSGVGTTSWGASDSYLSTEFAVEVHI
jgi:hypothetical protein